MHANSRQLEPDDIRDFMLAGKSIVTIKSLKTEKHFTYKIKSSVRKLDGPPGRYFVSVKDGNGYYPYMGMITASNGIFTNTRGSEISRIAPSFLAFKWVWLHIVNNSFPLDKVEVWHEGRCGRCGRQLTDPESIASGYGPYCRGRK